MDGCLPNVSLILSPSCLFACLGLLPANMLSIAALSLQGQSKASSSQAQIFYSSTPIWSALIAMILLREEGMSSLGWLGGLGILTAGIIAGR